VTRQSTTTLPGHEDNLDRKVVAWLSERLTGMVIAICRALGPAQLESLYASIGIERQVPLPVVDSRDPRRSVHIWMS
jgi:hypothetical protein